MSTITLFAPNINPSTRLLIHDDQHYELYFFLRNYFYPFYIGEQQFKPFTDVELMLEELEGFDEEYETIYSDDDNNRYETLEAWLEELKKSHPNPTIVCSDYL